MTDTTPPGGSWGDFDDNATTETVLHGDLTQLPQAVRVIDTPFYDLSYVVAAIPGDGLQVEAIDLYDETVLRTGPRFVDGTRHVTSVESFLAELQRRPLWPDESTVWANRDQQKITAIYDDHQGGVDPFDRADIDYDRRAGRRVDRLQLGLTLDEDWQAWDKVSRAGFHDQVTFGDVVEDLLHTVQSPNQATLLQVIDNIRSTSSGKFESSVNRQDGSTVRHYSADNNTTAGDVTIPDTITVRTRVFDGYPLEYEYDLWFRTRVADGSLRLAAKLKPRRRIYLAAWDEVTTEIHAAHQPGR